MLILNIIVNRFVNIKKKDVYQTLHSKPNDNQSEGLDSTFVLSNFAALIKNEEFETDFLILSNKHFIQVRFKYSMKVTVEPVLSGFLKGMARVTVYYRFTDSIQVDPQIACVMFVCDIRSEQSIVER